MQGPAQKQNSSKVGVCGGGCFTNKCRILINTPPYEEVFHWFSIQMGLLIKSLHCSEQAIVVLKCDYIALTRTMIACPMLHWPIPMTWKVLPLNILSDPWKACSKRMQKRNVTSLDLLGIDGMYLLIFQTIRSFRNALLIRDATGLQTSVDNCRTDRAVDQVSPVPCKGSRSL